MQRTGYFTPPMTEQALLDAISDEQQAAAFYDRLLSMQPNNESAVMLAAIRDDEWRHADRLLQLFRKLFRREPVLPAVKVVRADDITEGFARAIADEWDDYTTYRNWYLSSKEGWMRDLFFELMTDENKHAGKLNFLSDGET